MGCWLEVAGPAGGRRQAAGGGGACAGRVFAGLWFTCLALGAGLAPTIFGWLSSAAIDLVIGIVSGT